MAREQYQPSPAMEDYPSFGQQLMQHNAGTHLTPDAYGTDQQSYIHSGTNSGYVTPDPNHMPEQHGHTFVNPYTNQYEQRTMVGRDVYGNPLYYQQQNQDYYPAPTNQYPSPVPLRYTTSPPTPSASDISSTGKRKRPNRPRAAKEDASRDTETPKTKRAKPARGDKAKTPRLEAPLSVLTKDSDVPLKDMNAWVHRSADQRLKEVESRAGKKITRPMNSFMLYRSAYADRTKRWCTQNNHQVVSSVSGESWPMEPKEIRELYTEYARIERDNHQKAHPDYKFSPTKPGQAGRKRKDASEDDDQSELEELDSEYFPSSRNRPRRPRQVTPDASWPSSYATRYGFDSSMIPNSHSVNPSSYQYSNPNKPLPAPMIDHGQYGQYYQTIVLPNTESNTEDLFFQKTQVPNSARFGTAQGLSSIPGGGHHELLDDAFAEASRMRKADEFDLVIDPSLAGAFEDVSDELVNRGVGRDGQLSGQQTYTYQDPTPGPLSAISFGGFEDNTDEKFTDEEVNQFMNETNEN